MSDLSDLKETFEKIDIECTVRKDGEYEYLFIGERRDIYSMSGGEFNTFLDDHIDVVIRRHNFFEFENGKLASHFNS